MSKRKNVPEIRFKGFNNAWEQRKLGDFIEDYIEKTTIQNQYPVLTSSQQMGIVLQEEYFANRQVTTSENVGYFVLPKGYFTYRSRSDNDVFVFNRNDLIDKGIISYFYPVFRVKNADSDFFLRRLNFGIERQISIAAEGTGQHVLSLKKFKDVVAMFPSVQEQTKIGAFFRNLDNLITLYQQKLDKLKELKRAYLDQIFNQKIRFSGFSEEWEQSKLKYLSRKTYSGGTPKTSIAAYWTGNIPWIQSSDLKINEIYNIKASKFITEKAVNDSAAKLIPKDSIAIVTRVGVGKLAYMPYSYTTSQDFLSLSGLTVDIWFCVYSIYYLLKKEINNIQGTSIKGITKNDLLNKVIEIPKDVTEQQKIGIFFKQLDDTINLYITKINKLNKIKRGFLQKMFI